MTTRLGIRAVELSLAIVALAGCQAARTTATVGTASLSTQRRADIWPVVAAHQHLMSAEAIAVLGPIPSLPAITLPAELDRVLRRREAVHGAPPAGDLFTEDALVQNFGSGRWQRGRASIDAYLAQVNKRVQYVAHSYHVDGNAGHVAGTIRRDEVDLFNFAIGVTRKPGGAWQIATEILTLIPKRQYSAVVPATQLIDELDDAGIARGVVLSLGYWFGDPERGLSNADAAAGTRGENDWTLAQAAPYGDRLVVFCGVAVIAEYALDEMERCSKLPRVKGMKIHFGNSGSDLRNPEHADRIKRFFRAANERRLAIVVHARQRGGNRPGHAEFILNELLPLAPDIPIQVAHMGVLGREPDAETAVFERAIVAGDPRMKNVYFDITQTVSPDGSQSAETLARIAASLRRVGLQRIFFGTDMTGPGGNPPPREHWKAVRKLPLTDDELRIIATNVPPYMR